MKIATEFLALNCELAKNIQHSDKCTTLRVLSEWPFLIADPHGERFVKKGRLFFGKKTPIGHRSISLQSVCAKIKPSQMNAVKHHSAQKQHLSGIALQQIFDLFFTGSWVATIFVTSHAYHTHWELLIHISIVTVKWLHTYISQSKITHFQETHTALHKGWGKPPPRTQALFKEYPYNCWQLASVE